MDYLTLTLQQSASPRTRSLEWAVTQSEELITRFEWSEPSHEEYEETIIDNWAIDGVSERLVNQGFTKLHTSGGATIRFPVTSHGGVDVIDPKIKTIDPSRHDKVSKQAAHAIGINWANSILDPAKVGTATDTLVSLPAYCANMGRQYIPAANGGALNLIYLDRMIQMTSKVSDKPFFLVGDKMFARLSQLTRNQTIAGNMSMAQDSLGLPILMYNRIPIYGAGKTVRNQERIDFNETVGTEDESTSIYLIWTGKEGVYGLRRPLTDELNAKQYQLLPDGTYAPQLIHEIQQPLGIAIATPSSIVQLKGITDDPIVDEL